MNSESVAKAATQVVTVFADASNRTKMPREVYKKYGVRGIPRMMMIDSTGKVLISRIGRTEKAIISSINKAVKMSQGKSKDKKK